MYLASMFKASFSIFVQIVASENVASVKLSPLKMYQQIE